MGSISVLIAITVIISIKVDGLDQNKSETVIRLVIKPYSKNERHLVKRTGRNMPENGAIRLKSDRHHKMRTSSEKSVLNNLHKNNSWREVGNEWFPKKDNKNVKNYTDNTGETTNINNNNNIKHFRNGRNNKDNYNDNRDNYKDNKDNSQDNIDSYTDNIDSYTDNRDNYRNNRDDYKENSYTYKVNKDSYEVNIDTYKDNRDTYKDNRGDNKENRQNYKDSSEESSPMKEDNIRNGRNNTNYKVNSGESSENETKQNYYSGGNNEMNNFNSPKHLRNRQIITKYTSGGNSQLVNKLKTISDTNFVKSGSNNGNINRNNREKGVLLESNSKQKSLYGDIAAQPYRDNRLKTTSDADFIKTRYKNENYNHNNRERGVQLENNLKQKSIYSAEEAQPYVIKLDKNRDLILPNKVANQQMQPLQTIQVNKFYPHEAKDQIHLNSYKTENIVKYTSNNKPFDLQTSASNMNTNSSKPDIKLPLLIMKTDVTPQKFQNEANAFMRLQTDPQDFHMLLGTGTNANGEVLENKKLTKEYKKSNYVVKLRLPHQQESDDIDDKHYKEYKPEHYFTGEELELFHQGKLKYDMNVAPQIEIVEEKGHSEEYVESETRGNQQVMDKNKESNNPPVASSQKPPHQDVDSYDHYDYSDSKHKPEVHKDIHQLLDDIYNSSDDHTSAEHKQEPRKKKPRQKKTHLLKITNMRKPTSLI